MLLREYAIKWGFVIQPLLSNDYLEKHEHEPRKLCLFSHAAYHVLKIALLWLAISSTLIN